MGKSPSVLTNCKKLNITNNKNGYIKAKYIKYFLASVGIKPDSELMEPIRYTACY